jgi:hypothetical protein
MEEIGERFLGIDMIRLQRDKIKIVHNKNDASDDYVLASPEECMSFVWELTKEVYSLSGEYDVESRLQRHVVHIIRK